MLKNNFAGGPRKTEEIKKQIHCILDESIAVKENTKRLSDVIEKIARAVIKCYRSGGKVVLFGNGGSAADCQHIAAELMCRFEKERRPFAAVALTTDTSLLTAIPNDYSFEDVFARQVDGIVNRGDAVIAISTSGNSPNVVAAARRAGKRGAIVIGFTGALGGRLKSACGITLMVPSRVTARVQEVHITVGHIVCKLIENELS